MQDIIDAMRFGSADDACRQNAALPDAERLRAYDAFARDVRLELEDVSARMDALRGQNKVKTATYRQLFAQRITLKDIDRRLRERAVATGSAGAEA